MDGAAAGPLLAVLGCWGSLLQPLLGLFGVFWAGVADLGFVSFGFLLFVHSSELIDEFILAELEHFGV